MLNDSYYLFVEVAAQRCSQLMHGAKPKVDLRAHKQTTVACAEVKEDLIPWTTATDEQIAVEHAEAVAAEAAAMAASQTHVPGAMRDFPNVLPGLPAKADDKG